ncbi:AI-2E family transporter [Salinisphaera sp.]|uniref:AI-2E family transporter n=1 Tax=Salinisphaera sp. TaxID=1914330 RepID=UPI002D79232C|nr:AI-2E family transporter [Salinisphaera sp.]HET7313693.1 AI-2E family transporter [Salinisphaera sp.]
MDTNEPDRGPDGGSSHGPNHGEGRLFGPTQGLLRWACFALIGLCLCVGVAVLSLAKEFLVPVVLAFLLSMVFGPVRRFFDRRGIPPALSAAGIVLVLMALLLGLVSALAVPVSQWIDNAPRIERQIQRRVAEISQSVNGLIEVNHKIEDITQSGEGQVEKVKVKQPGMAATVLITAPAILAQFVFTFVLLLFLLASGDMFYEKLVHVLPSFRDKRRAVAIAFNIERKLSRYLLTITMINAGVGIAVGISMALVGMPDALLIGLIVFLLNFIPYLGALAGMVLVAAVALVSFDWIGWVPIVAGIYFGISVIEGQFITPYLVGRSLRLNTVVVFLSISFWAWLWSVVGMVVAVPLLVAIRTLSEHIDGLHALGDFLSERHAEHFDDADDETAPPS